MANRFSTRRTPQKKNDFARGRTHEVEPQKATTGGSTGLPAFLQPKLHVGAIDDPLEREADRVAEQVMSSDDTVIATSNGNTGIQRKCECGGSSCGECEACRDKREDERSTASLIQRRAIDDSDAGADAPPSVHEALRWPGKPLDGTVRQAMESRFGRDLSDVRVHTDGLAGDSALGIDARAYTAGNSMVFAPGQYAPETEEGQRLIAHELAHVVQQEGAPGAVRRQLFWGFGQNNELGDDPTSDELYRRYFGFGGKVDERAEALAKQLHLYVAKHPSPYDFIRKLFDIIPSDYEDNVASNFVAQLDELQLIRFAVNDPGHTTLDMLYEAMMTGDVSGFERQQAARLEQFGGAAARQRQTIWSMMALASVESAQSVVEGLEIEVKLHHDIDSAAEHLARKLRGYADAHPGPYTYLREVFQLLPDACADNVAAEFVATMDNDTLEAFGKPEAAQDLLNLLYEALITGNVSGFERFEAERILRLKTARTPLAEYEAYQQHRLVFPVKYQKFLRDCYAPISAELLPGGMVRAWYGTVRVWQCDEFKADRATLGVSDTRLVDEGIVLKADDIVTVKLYDEDERELDIPAIGLIDYANESKNRTLSLAGQAFLAGLTLPVGGAAETAFGRALLIADRVAWGISVVSSLVNDNRDWIASLPGGQTFLEALDSVNRLAGYYGWARLGGEALHFAAGKLGPAYRAWEAEPKLGLTEEQSQIVAQLNQHTESIVNDLETAEREAHAAAPSAEGEKAPAEPAEGEPEKAAAEPSPAKPPEQVDPRIADRVAKAARKAGAAHKKFADAAKAFKQALRGGSKVGAQIPSFTAMLARTAGSLGQRLGAMVYYYAKSRAAASFEAFLQRLAEDGEIELSTLGQGERDLIERTFNEAMEMSRTGELAYGEQIYPRLSQKAKSVFSEERVDVMAAQLKAAGKTDEEVIAAIEGELPRRVEQAVITHQVRPLGGGRFELESQGIIGEPHFTRTGVEKKYPLGRDVGLPGYVRYHVEGIGAVGDELNIVYAPERFNISETAEVENRIREIRANARGELNYNFKVAYRIHGEYQGVTIKVLESITWELEERALGSADFNLLFRRSEAP